MWTKKKELHGQQLGIRMLWNNVQKFGNYLLKINITLWDSLFHWDNIKIYFEYDKMRGYIENPVILSPFNPSRIDTFFN